MSKLDDKKLANVTYQVKASSIMDQARHLTAAPLRDEKVMLIDGLLNQSIIDKTACSGVPTIVFLVPCETTSHKMNSDLAKISLSIKYFREYWEIGVIILLLN